MLYDKDLAAHTVQRLAVAFIRMSGPLDITDEFDGYMDVDSAQLSAVLRTPDDVAALCDDLNVIFAAENTTLFAEPVVNAAERRTLRGSLKDHEMALVVRPSRTVDGSDKTALAEYQAHSRYYGAWQDGVVFIRSQDLSALNDSERVMAIEKQMTALVYTHADGRSKTLAAACERVKSAAEQAGDADALAMLKLVDGVLSMDRWLHSQTTPEQRAAATDDWKQSRNQVLDESEGRLYALYRRLGLDVAELLHK